MKTNYQPSEERRKRRRRRFTLSLLFCIAILFLLGGVFHRALSPLAVSISSPFFSAFEGARTFLAPVFSIPLRKGEILRENERLRTLLFERDQKLVQFQFLDEELQLRSEAVGGEDSSGILLAAVVIRPDHSPYDTLLVDRGEKDGVKVGNRVSVGGVVIGEVDEAYGSRSRVKLFSFPGRETPVFVGESRIEAVATGRGGGNFETRLPRGVAVQSGDRIVLPDAGESVFALVEEVESKASDTFQRILFKNPVNMAELHIVRIHLSSL